MVPSEVLTMPREKVKLAVSPDAIPTGYLASVAYEWDTWGASYPIEFVDALAAELDPKRREFISTLLTTLGRTTR